jgi:outer membrane protein
MNIRFHARTIATMAALLGLAASPVAVEAQGAGASQPAGQAAAQSAAAQTGPTLPLSMQQAVAMALEANLGLKSARLNLDVASESIALAKSAFLPQLQGTIGRQRSKYQPSDFTQGSSDISTTGVNGSAALGQALKFYGSSYTVSWSGSRFNQDGGLSSFNPRVGSTLQATFAQPLLRNFKTDASRTSLVTSQWNREITDLSLRQSIVTTEAAVKLAYLNLVAAIEGKKVAEQNMEIAQKSLAQSKARVAVGQAAQIEIIQFESQVASNQEQLILTEAQIGTAEDVLRSLIFEPGRTDFWQVRLVPTDTPRLTASDVNVDQVIANALANRMDLIAEKRSLDITNLNLELGHNNTLPSVNLNASYSSQGTAGTQYTYGSGFPPPVIGRSDRPWTSALADTFLGDFPTWSLGVTIGYPIGKTAAEAAYAQSQVQKRQQELTLEDLKLQIVRQVRDAARQVTNSYQRVQATQTFRQAAEQQLDAEERRFAVGMSTILDLQVRQSQLATARVSELNATIDYNRALIVLERVQKAR